MPSARNGLELFAGEWASKLPEPFDTFRGSGGMALFADERITWADEKLRALGAAGFAGAKILELGPLEGGHSFMMSRMGAKSVLALEANARAFLKCLVAKEALGMPGVTFWLGNALRYLREPGETFDVGVACAFLNHLVEPVEVIELLARRCRAVFLWNVVYDATLFEKMPEMKPNFGPGQPAEWSGFRHTLYPHFYGQVESYKRFWGGLQPSCCWMRPDDILGALKAFGFGRIESRIEDNPFGKAVAVVAVRG
jgi:hypothetical protein